MRKINETNYLHLLQETSTVLDSVNRFLKQDFGKNRAEIAEINRVIGLIQNVAKLQRRKAIWAKNESAYTQAMEEQVARQERLKQQLRDINGQKI